MPVVCDPEEPDEVADAAVEVPVVVIVVVELRPEDEIKDVPVVEVSTGVELNEDEVEGVEDDDKDEVDEKEVVDGIIVEVEVIMRITVVSAELTVS